MKKYILPVALIILGIVAAVLAATDGLFKNAIVTWILAILLIVIGCWLLFAASKAADTKSNEHHAVAPEISELEPVSPSVTQETIATATDTIIPGEAEPIPQSVVSDVVESAPQPIVLEADEAASHESETVESLSRASTCIDFRLTGVIQNNEDGESRQELIRKIMQNEPPFENNEVLDIQLLPSTYEGERTMECRVNGRLIGFVPKKNMKEVAEAMDKKGMKVSAFNILGDDNERLVHGVEITVRYDSE